MRDCLKQRVAPHHFWFPMNTERAEAGEETKEVKRGKEGVQLQWAVVQ